jgi:hypothetical protein
LFRPEPGFGFWFVFFPILKYGDMAGKKDIDIHSKLVLETTLLISNYILSLLNYKSLNELLNYFIYLFLLSIKQIVFSIYLLYFKNHIVEIKYFSSFNFF